MKKSKRINIKIVSLIVFLLIILFPSYIHSIQTKEKVPSEVIVGGELLQINMNTRKIMFYTLNDENNKLKNYDLVEKIEGDAIQQAFNKESITNIRRKDIFYIVLAMKNNEKVKFTVLRDNKQEDLYLTREELNHSYFTEEIPFCATLTYINPEDNSFGAVAHNIDVNNDVNLISKTGDIYLCNSLEIKKSNNNQVGNMHGEKIYSSQGEIIKVDDFGAKGIIKGKEILKNKDIYKVAKAEEIKNGSASLLIKNPGDINSKAYEINITKANKQLKAQTQGFEFNVIDEGLIKDYGGIVQGMSGSPIIQNGKIIGALSHVIASDPKKGIGLYIEWMMEE